MTPALNRGLRKAMRTAIQMITSGGLTALVDVAVHDLSPVAQLAVAAAWMYVVTFAQNSLETAGKIPTLLPTSGLVGSATAGEVGVSPSVGTVDASADSETGEVTGIVTDTEGATVGEVIGQLGYVEQPKEDHT